MSISCDGDLKTNFDHLQIDLKKKFGKKPNHNEVMEYLLAVRLIPGYEVIKCKNCGKLFFTLRLNGTQIYIDSSGVPLETYLNGDPIGGDGKLVLDCTNDECQERIEV